MAVKTVTIDLEAYRLLLADKREGESFSMVIKRRLRPIRTAEALLKNLEKLALSEDALDRIDELIRARAGHVAHSPPVDLED